MSAKKLIDFTGQAEGFQKHDRFGQNVIDELRKDGPGGEVVVIDYAIGLSEPAIVSDHLNLTGSSPLSGPNNPIGERFPVVNGIYVCEDAKLPQPLQSLKKVVIAGLKDGVKTGDKELELIKSLGADAFCKNVVHTMIVAAHAKKTVLAVVVPEGKSLSAELLSAIAQLN
ncbi:MAG TPA: hypothetical protein PKZ32_04475 [Candidatus Melainabacteria bacterium]|nr:hypothetical protein [Candidatus Melainabacteria bacterium]